MTWYIFSMRGVSKLSLGCLTMILLAVALWVALQFILLPALEKDAHRQGHTLKDYISRVFYGR